MKKVFLIVLVFSVFYQLMAKNQDSSSSADKFPIDISVGACFDFLDKIQANSLYGDVSYENIDAWTVRAGKNFLGCIGLSLGFYNGRTITSDSGLTENLSRQKGIFRSNEIKDSSVSVVEKNFSEKKTVRADIFCPYATFNFQLAKILFFLGHLEARQNRILYESEKGLVSVDTLDRLSVTDAIQVYPQYSDVLTAESSYTEKKKDVLWSFTLAGGFMFYHNIKNAGKIKLNLLIGDEIAYEDGHYNGHCLGIGKMSFASANLLNLKTGIEVRARFSREVVSYPEILFYVSKVFKFDKLLSLIGET